MKRSRLARWALPAAFVSSVASCGAPPRPVPAEPAAEPAAPPPSGREAPAAEDEAQRAVEAALAETSRARELPAKGSVRAVVLARSEMAERVRRSVEKEVPPDVIQGEADVLMAFGLVPSSFDYLASVTSLLGAELAGFYEPETKTMFLSSELRGAERATTLAHELVHALQDQYYGLTQLLDYEGDQSDRMGAVHALAEGDATSAMLDQVLAPQHRHATDLSDELVGLQVRSAAAMSSAGTDVPAVLTRSLIAPYTDGISFVHALRRRGGWKEVDAAWREPPVTTEQLLHLEKFLAREPAVVIPAPPAPAGSRLSRVHTDVFGEQSLRIVFEEWVPRRAAVEAAAGWAGDRVAVFREGALVASVLWVRYDDEASATRGADAFLRGGQQQGAGRRRGNGGCFERPTRGPFEIRRRARDIVIVAGPFRRVGGATESAGVCGDAEKWSAAILATK